MNLDLKDIISVVEKLENEVKCLEEGVKTGRYNVKQQDKIVSTISELKNNIEKSITDLSCLI